MNVSTNMSTSQQDNFHKLNSNWTLYSHLPHDTDWSLKSYQEITEIDTIEKGIGVIKHIPERTVQNCMLFIMRNKIKPMWEDTDNRQGGCFSFKVTNAIVASVWERLAYTLIGETLFKGDKNSKVNGITISPKKNFCIIKVWMKDCSNQNPFDMNLFDGLTSNGCLFKKHAPEF